MRSPVAEFTMAQLEHERGVPCMVSLPHAKREVLAVGKRNTHAKEG
jgi:hypothetical protein